MTKKPKKAKPDQHRAFKETARALECDESEKAFDKALKKLGSSPSEKPKGR